MKRIHADPPPATLPFLVMLLSLVILLLLLVATVEAQNAAAPERPIVQQIAVARFVYVTSYDGPGYLADVRAEDREAIADVETALRLWGHYIVVISPQDADLIFVVQRYPNEDVLAIYDAKSNSPNPLWWASQRGGLDPVEMPFIERLKKQVERAH